MFFCVLFAMRFQLGTPPPPRGTVGCATFPFRVGFRRFVSPPCHDGGLRESFDVGFSCHSACVLLQFAFLRLAPAATLAILGMFLTVVCLIIVPSRLALPATPAVRARWLKVVSVVLVIAFSSPTVFRVFPGFMAKSSRGVGVGFEEPHLLFIL